MPTFKQNLSELNSYVMKAPEENKTKIKKIIELYDNKQIPNVKTAINTVKLLATTNKNIIKSGKPEREYLRTINKYQYEEPITGRLSREPEHTMTTGNNEKV